MGRVDTLIPIHYGQVKVIPKGKSFQVVVQNYEHKLLDEWVEDFSYFLDIIRKTIQTGKPYENIRTSHFIPLTDR